MTMTRLFATLFALMLTGLTPAQAQDDLLRAEEAFTFAVSEDAGEIVVDWTVVDGYYLYKEKLEFALEGTGASLESPFLPRGVDYSDEFFGEQQIYTDDFQVRLPYANGAGPATLVIRSQGCSKSFGICFPPQTQRATLTLASTTKAAAKALPFEGPNADDFLPPERAFAPRVTRVGADSLEVGWEIAPGYYLYSESIEASFDDPNFAPGPLGLPRGESKTDEYFGETTVYYDGVFVTVPLVRKAAEASVQKLTLTYQGCAEAGICYPPMSQSFNVNVPAGSITAGGAPSAAAATAAPGPVSEQAKLATLIRDGNLLLVLGTFFGLGLLLSLTPCVLPMVPILSGIIAGEGDKVTPMRGFTLALLYVLGMALTYTVAGAAFAAAGQQAQTFFQQPWILITFAGLFVVLAMGMFGMFNLQMPSVVQSRLAEVSGKQRNGTAVGAFVMGALSSLVVTACVAPPLVAALAVIGQTGDVVRGASALFSLSMGMGTPLLIVGASAGRLLPKVGPWMETVKQAFGFIMLGVAIYMLSRLLPGEVVLLAWAVLIVIAAVYLGALTPLTADASGGQRLGKGFGLLGVLYGAVLFIGALTGGEDPLQPLKGSLLASTGGAAAVETRELEFVKIKTVEDLDRAVADASANGRAVMLDFYADWCPSCKEMEKYTFTDAEVNDVLANTLLLKADVTANDDADQALLKRFGIYGPPSIIFFGPDGQERPGYQVVGYMKAPKFASHVRQAIAVGGASATTAQR